MEGSLFGLGRNRKAGSRHDVATPPKGMMGSAPRYDCRRTEHRWLLVVFDDEEAGCVC